MHKKTDDIKEKLIQVTTELISDSDGNAQHITTRAIAEKAQVGVGLINYHFQTKEHLIEICVQRMIGNVISAFQPNVSKELDCIENLKETAKQVVDFLMEHPEISKISIMSDLSAPGLTDNTMKTVWGFLSFLPNYDMPQQEKLLLTYSMTLMLQGMFLKKDITAQALHLDFNKKEQRDVWIDFMMERLYRNGEKSK